MSSFNPIEMADEDEAVAGISVPVLAEFVAQGWITGIHRQVKSGKEATVYCCHGEPKSGAALVAAKVYLARQARNFKNDAVYQEGRYVADRRQRRAMERKTATGRETQSALWLDHEYRTLGLLHEVGADVPRPITSGGGVILMDYVGDLEAPAPLLAHVAPEPDEAWPLFRRVMRNVELLLACNCVHGDLSAYNMLYWEGAITIIDVPQAVDPRTNPNARDLLARDVENICRYFSRHGVRGDPGRITQQLWARFMRGEL